MATNGDGYNFNMEVSMKKLGIVLLNTVLVWILVVSFMQRMKNPRLTNTELFFAIPGNIILIWR